MRRTFLSAVLVSLLVLACAHAPSPVAPSRTVILFVPGYKGSTLVGARDGKLVWITARRALFGGGSLRLPLPGMGFGPAPELRADQVLRRVSLVPFVSSVDIYGSLLDALAERTGCPVVGLAYDWRKDLAAAAALLAAKVRALRAEGYAKVWLVAHSQGGLVASYYLRYGGQRPETARETWEGAKEVERVVLAGVPFRGTMIAFRNLQEGENVVRNRTLLDADADDSFPSAYLLLPTGELDELLTRAGPVLGALHEATAWPRRRWGLLRKVGGLSPSEKDLRGDYTRAWIEAGARFQELVSRPVVAPPPQRIPLLVLHGDATPTLSRGYWDEAAAPPQASVLFDEAAVHARYPEAAVPALSEAGDGVISARSSDLPAAYRAAFSAREVGLPEAHRELVSAESSQRLITGFLAPANQVP